MKESSIMNMTTSDQVNNSQSIQHQHHDDIELNWYMVHEEICWKCNTMIVSMNDIIIEYNTNNKGQYYYIATNELPTKNDVIVIDGTTTTNDNKKKKQYQYTETNMNDIVKRFIQYRKVQQQEQKQKEDITSSSLSTPTKSSSVVSYAAQVGYYYLIKSPMKIAYETVIGTSDYVKHLDEFEKTSINDSIIDNDNENENELINSDDNIISLIIILKALQCLYDIILNVEPIILSNSNNNSAVLYDWIRSKLVVIPNENNDNNNIIQFILNLNNNQIDLLILCLNNMNHQEELNNDNNHFVFTNEITNNDNEITSTIRNDIWIIGYDINQSIEIRIILYDIEYTIQKIEMNIKKWEDIVNQCMNDAIRYKKLNKIEQALIALQRKKLYITKIDSSRNILLTLEQHKFTIESTINTQNILNTYTQTTNTLRSLRINYENSQANNNDVVDNDELETTTTYHDDNYFDIDNNDGDDDSGLIMELQAILDSDTTTTTTTTTIDTTKTPSKSNIVVDDDQETNNLLLRLKALSININNNKTTTTKQEEDEDKKQKVTVTTLE